MTGPKNYREAKRLLAEANEFIRFRQQPLQSGPADLPEAAIASAVVSRIAAHAVMTAMTLLRNI